MIYHILNGDALKEKFPPKLEGEIIVLREALISGPVSSTDFFENRAKYITTYFDATIELYKEKSEKELLKLKDIPQNAEVNFWFEDDLFCQCNFWFACHLLSQAQTIQNTNLIRPDTDSWTGFGIMNAQSLEKAFLNKAHITQSQLQMFSKLWTIYQQGETKGMNKIAEELTSLIPRLPDVIVAHIDRIETKDNPGKPKKLLKSIIHSLDTKEFGKVFRAFQEEAGIYGFGDSQVKIMFDEIIDHQGS